MHPKFAKRLAKQLMVVKSKDGIIAASEWWKSRFRQAPQSEFQQVMVEFKKLPSAGPPPKKGA